MKNSTHGFGLIEVVVYTALLVIIGLAISGFIFQLARSNARVQTTSQTLDEARQAMATLTFEIRHAQSIYDPTSQFETHPGQLSLATGRNAPSDHAITYVDFYVDDERLYVKREGQAAQMITSERIRITNLVFTSLQATSSAASPSPSPTASTTPSPTPASSPASTVRIELTAVPEGALTDQSEVTLYATAAFRSYLEDTSDPEPSPTPTPSPSPSPT